jgi:hypothetical protein
MATSETPAEEFNRLTAIALTQITRKQLARIRVLSNYPENCGLRHDVTTPRLLRDDAHHVARRGCQCECNSGGFCGGCGHAGCGRR